MLGQNEASCMLCYALDLISAMLWALRVDISLTREVEH